ncbi:MAG: DUF1499 domain-containing protein [Myxococcota bacterium]
MAGAGPSGAHAPHTSNGAPRASRLATAAAIVAVVALSLPAIGVVGIHVGALAPMTGFYAFAAGAVLGGLLATLLGFAGLVATRGGRDPDGRLRAWTGLGGGLALLGVVAIAAGPSSDLPPINDIATDLADPPAFAGDPSGRGRDMTYPVDFVAQVRAAYPDLHPHVVGASPDEAFDRAASAANALGWDVTRADEAAGVLEARDTTAIFRFVDDVVVRVRPHEQGAVVDVRSKSRDGRGDLGANAARIRAFVAKL